MRIERYPIVEGAQIPDSRPVSFFNSHRKARRTRIVCPLFPPQTSQIAWLCVCDRVLVWVCAQALWTIIDEASLKASHQVKININKAGQ